MTKRCRNRVRNRGKVRLTADTAMVKLFDYTQRREAGWEEWQFRMVSYSHVAKMLDEGTAERVTRMKYGCASCVGYRALTPTRPLRRTPCTLTMTTMNVVSKRAMGEALDDWERDQAHKFDVWALVGEPGLVRPRISEAEQKRAEYLLGAKRLPIGATFEPGLLAA